MKRSATLGAAMIAACAAALAPTIISTAMADGWRHRGSIERPRPYARNLYRGGIRYYNNACGYGDCACLRGLALSTGKPVWWDKYQACTG